MSRERDILRVNYERLVDQLEATDPITQPHEFKKLLELLDRVYYAIAYRRFTVDQLMEDVPFKVYEVGEAIPVSDVKPGRVEKTAEPEPAEEKPAKPEPVEEEPAKTYTKEEVRAALAKSRKNGVNVTELLDELGYDNFSAVPAGKYGEIMAKLGES